jgi:threonyl-tRNA synthetase
MNQDQSNPQDLHALRHSAEHVLHQAVKELYPRIHLAMGPSTDDGFYFDFDATPEGREPVTITVANFPKIEKRMAEIIKKNLPITRHEILCQKLRRFR